MVFFSALSRELNNFWFCHGNLPLKMSAVIVCVKNTSENSYFLTFPSLVYIENKYILVPYVLLNIFEVIKNSKDVQALCFGLHTLLNLNT